MGSRPLPAAGLQKSFWKSTRTTAIRASGSESRSAACAVMVSTVSWQKPGPVVELRRELRRVCVSPTPVAPSLRNRLAGIAPSHRCLCWYPQRDSNPRCRLERVSRVLVGMPMLSVKSSPTRAGLRSIPVSICRDLGTYVYRVPAGCPPLHPREPRITSRKQYGWQSPHALLQGPSRSVYVQGGLVGWLPLWLPDLFVSKQVRRSGLSGFSVGQDCGWPDESQSGTPP